MSLRISFQRTKSLIDLNKKLVFLTQSGVRHPSIRCHPSQVDFHSGRIMQIACSMCRKSENKTGNDEAAIPRIYVRKEKENPKVDDLLGSLDELEEDAEPPIASKFRHSVERGKEGVFDVTELVSILRDEKVKDICVIRVPAELQYADHMVVATCYSTRHLRALSLYLNQLYKARRHPSDRFIHLEGAETSKNWIAVDFGNIALHLFLENAREEYDLEMLWTVGEEHDDQVIRMKKQEQARLETLKEWILASTGSKT